MLWRAPTNLDLPVVRVLPDGTYQTVLIKPTVRGARRRQAILDAAAGELATGYDERWEQETGHPSRALPRRPRRQAQRSNAGRSSAA